MRDFIWRGMGGGWNRQARGVPLAEPAMRQSLIMSHGSIEIFFTRPIAGTIMVIAIGLFLWPLVNTIRRRLGSGGSSAGPGTP